MELKYNVLYIQHHTLYLPSQSFQGQTQPTASPSHGNMPPQQTAQQTAQQQPHVAPQQAGQQQQASTVQAPAPAQPNSMQQQYVAPGAQGNPYSRGPTYGQYPRPQGQYPFTQ